MILIILDYFDEFFAVLGNKFKFTNVIDEVFCKVSNLCTCNCSFPYGDLHM